MAVALVNLADLLRAGELGISVVVLGTGGVEREIGRSQVTDLSDPSRYLAEGDLVLTNALWAATPGGTESFVSAAVRSNVAGVVIGLVDGAAVPDGVILQCRVNGLTLATVGEELSLTVLAERIAELRPDGLSVRLARGHDFGRRLLEVERARGGPSATLDLLQAVTGRDCWLMSDVGSLIAATGVPPSSSVVAATWNARPTAPGSEPVVMTGPESDLSAIWAISSHSRIVCGYLVVRGDYLDLGADGLVQIDAIATALQLDLELAVRRRDAADASVSELVGALADESVSIGEISARLRLLGIDPQRPLLVVTAAVSDDAFPPEATLMMVQAMCRPYVASERGCIERDSIVLFLNQLPEDDVDFPVLDVDPWLPFLNGRQLRVAISDPVSSIEQLSSALAVARERLVATSGAGAVIVTRHSSVASHRGLLSLLGDRTRTTFAADVLDPLVDYDRRNNTELVPTLLAFLESGGAWVQTARALDLHPNTMRYRMGRVEDLTGRDLSRMSDRVDLFLAFVCRDL